MKTLMTLFLLLVASLAAAAGLPAPAQGAGAMFDPDLLPAVGIAGLIVNQANLRTLFTGFKAAFNEGFRAADATWRRVATPVPSTAKGEKYGWLGQFPRLREWLGDRHVKGLSAHDYEIRNKKFESTIAVPRDDIEDDSYGVFTPLFREMGHAAQTHPDELVFALLAAGFTTTCYDGQFFFDIDHPVGNAETGITSVSNMQAGAGNPWFLIDASRPLKPLIFQRRRDYALKSMTREDDENVFMRDEFRYGVDARANVGFAFWQQAFGSKAALDQTNFDAAVAAMMAVQSDEGRPLGIKPTLLIVGPSNRAAAQSVVGVRTLANGADNPNYQAVETLVVPWLA